MKIGRIVALLAGVLALGVTGITQVTAQVTDPAADGDGPPPTGELVQIGSVTYADWGHRDARDGKIRALETADFSFKGTFIRGEPGQVLTMELKNVADQVHNFSIPAQGVNQDIPPKGHPPLNVSVTFPASGELQFLCKYHTAQGMNGQLRVGDDKPELAGRALVEGPAAITARPEPVDQAVQIRSSTPPAARPELSPASAEGAPCLARRVSRRRNNASPILPATAS